MLAAQTARDWAAKWRLARRLRREHFDLAILFPNSFEGAAVVRLAGVKRIGGYARDGRGWLLSNPVTPPRKGEIPPHERFYYLELLRRAGLIESLPEVPAIRLDGIPEARLRGEELFQAFGVSPGAAYGAAKRWLPERFGESAARLATGIGGSVAVFGSAAEMPMCE